MKLLVKFDVIHRGTRKVRALTKYEPMHMIEIKMKLVDIVSEWVCVCMCACKMLMPCAHIHLSCHTFLTYFPVMYKFCPSNRIVVLDRIQFLKIISNRFYNRHKRSSTFGRCSLSNMELVLTPCYCPLSIVV